MTPFWKVIRIALIAAPVAGVAACANNQIERKQETANAARDVSGDIQATKNQIDATLTSLDNLVGANQSPTQAAFQRYSKDVDKMEAQAKRVDKDKSDMHAQGQKYLADWEASHGKIQNEELRHASQGRREEVMQRMQNIDNSYDRTHTALNAFIRNLEDIRTAMRNDLTPSGVQSISATDIVANARSNGAEVKSNLDTVQADSSGLADALAPSAQNNGQNRSAQK
jgi:hypothetical protein